MGTMRRFLIVLLDLKCNCISYFLQMVLTHCHWASFYMALPCGCCTPLVVLISSCCWCYWKAYYRCCIFIFNLLSVQMGYMNLCSTSFRCSFSSFRRCDLEQTFLVLYVGSVKHAIYGSTFVIGVSKQIMISMSDLSVDCCGKDSVWFWYDRVSKNDMEPYGLFPSVVHWMQGSIELMCFRNFILFDAFFMIKFHLHIYST